MALSLNTFLSSFTGGSRSRPTRVVGVDLGASSIKVIEVEQRDEVLALATYGELQLGPYAQSEMGRSVKLALKQKVDAVIDVIRESKVKAKDGVLALPLSQSFVTVISISAPPNEDIASRVNVESRKHIPIPMTDVSLEWAEIDSMESTPQSVREVLLAAIQNNALNDSRELLKTVKMTSQPSEIELFSALRATTKKEDTGLAVIDLGAQTSKIYISQNGYLRRIHRVRIGGSLVTEQIGKALGVSFEEAENLKRNCAPGSQHEAQVRKIVHGAYARPLQEFKRAIAQHEIRSGQPLSRIVICGGAVMFNDFLQFASYELGRQVSLANPFTKVAYPAFMEDTLVQIAPVFVVALGCALRPFEE